MTDACDKNRSAPLALVPGAEILTSEKGDFQYLDRSSLDTNPAAVYLARMTSGSRRVQRGALDTIARLAGGADALAFPWHMLRYQHAIAIRSKILERAYAPKTANRMLAALRGVLRECWRLGLTTVEECERACDLPPVRGYREPVGRALAAAELTALFGTCDDTPIGIRDAALLAVLYSGGVRRSEAVGLDTGDYDPARGSLHIRAGKNNKDRRVFLAEFATDRLDSYRGTIVAGALFLRAGRGGQLMADRLTDAGVRIILKRRCEQAGIPVIAPHSMRRTMISDLLDAGVDLATVQKIAGHSSPTTTAAYDRRGEDAQRRAAQRLTI